MNYTEKEYWIKAEKSFEILHACSGCKRKQSFVNTGCFRLNANGNKLDVWLIYQCQKCRHTLNIPIFERSALQKLTKSFTKSFLKTTQSLPNSTGAVFHFSSQRSLRLTKILRQLLFMTKTEKQTRATPAQALSELSFTTTAA